MKKVLKSLGITLLALAGVIAAGLLVFVLLQPVLYPDYYSSAQKEYKIAGLSEGFVPQGLAYSEEQGLYLQCGYMSDGTSASRIYLVDAKTQTEKSVLLQTEAGQAYLGHTGGIAVSGDTVWLANDGEGEDNCVWVLSLETLCSAADGGSVTVQTRFYPECRAAYCYADDEYFWVGEFYRDPNYLTEESHTMTITGSEENHAFICAYPLDTQNELGISSETPQMILSVTGLVQGFTRTGTGSLVLSASYGLANSHLYIYENVLEREADAVFSVNDTQVPVWYLDSEALTKTVTLPPMSEDLQYVDGRIAIMYESASAKYIFGRLMRGSYVYSYFEE